MEPGYSSQELTYAGKEGGTRVLVVDDEEVIRILFREALGDEFQVACSDSTEQALPFLECNPPDVLVVDKNLPDRSGLELLKIAKTMRSDVEVIVITAYASLNSSLEALRSGAFDYLPKPFENLELVVEKIRRAGQKNRMMRERRQLLEKVVQTNQELRVVHERLRKGYLQTLTSMITALEARDAYTRGHSDRVAEYSLMIGRELNLSGERLSNLIDGARLHDVGKIGIREEVLHKIDALSEEEYAHIKTHPQIGADIIGKMESYLQVVPFVRHHHERFDGLGYPDGLRGEDIPLEARIIAVADSFDAMISSRAYRRPFSYTEALKVVHDLASTQLDPEVVKAFLACQRRLGTPA